MTMAITATLSPATGRLALRGETARPGCAPRRGDGRLSWTRQDGSDAVESAAGIDTAVINGDIGCDAFTISASSGRVRVFRAFLDQPQYASVSEQRRERRRRRSAEAAGRE
jgi:hypothetical protein